MRKDNLINSVLILGSCILILTSCKHDKYAKEIKDASPYFTNFFTGTDEDILRNVNFNVSLDEVKKIEQAKLYETTADHLFYELDIITTDIYLNDSAQVAQTKKSFEQYYTKRYGKSERDEKGYDIWNGEFTDTKTKKDFNYSVALTELEEEVGIKIEYLKE